jgi:flagellar export protein FliJ
VKAFRFRAAPLLDLRRRQYDAARAELARLTEAVRLAGHRLEIAERRRIEADADHNASLRRGSTVDQLLRHRNWIASLQLIVNDTRRSLEMRRDEAARGAAVVRDHFMRVRILERLRDRAKVRHANETRREEMKEIDLLAVLQHGRANHRDHPDHRDY